MSLKNSVTVSAAGSAMNPVSRSALQRFLPLEPGTSFRVRAQADEARVVGVLPRPLAPLAHMGLQHPPEERVAPPEGVAPALAVATPELLFTAHPLHRPAPEPPQLEPQRQVEPDDRVRFADHEVTELALVIAVDHPAVWRGGHGVGAAGAEALVSRLLPAGRGPVQCVEPDVRHAGPPRELLREGRLAGAGRALEVDPTPPSSSSAAFGS